METLAAAGSLGQTSAMIVPSITPPTASASDADRAAALDRLAEVELQLVQAGLIRMRICLLALTFLIIGWYFENRGDLPTIALLVPGVPFIAAVYWFTRHWSRDRDAIRVALEAESAFVTPEEWDTDRRERWQRRNQERRAKRWRR